MASSALYSNKGTNKYTMDSEGWIYGYAENGIQHTVCGPEMSAVLLGDMDPKDSATLLAKREVVLRKVDAVIEK